MLYLRVSGNVALCYVVYIIVGSAVAYFGFQKTGSIVLFFIILLVTIIIGSGISIYQVSKLMNIFRKENSSLQDSIRNKENK
jgi:ABC-type transport system involved in cytochrome bd biosynthesis fused ATPase/permease subunit